MLETWNYFSFQSTDITKCAQRHKKNITRTNQAVLSNTTAACVINGTLMRLDLQSRHIYIGTILTGLEPGELLQIYLP